jgi:type IV pilus assembly protein PilX
MTKIAIPQRRAVAVMPVMRPLIRRFWGRERVQDPCPPSLGSGGWRLVPATMDWVSTVRSSMHHRTAKPRAVGGFILVSGLIFLVVVTLLSLSILRSQNTQESIAGNTRDKQRAYEAAQSALHYGEWWLSRASERLPQSGCSNAVVNGNDLDNMVICAAAPGADVLALPWPYRIEYRPPGLTKSSAGGLALSGDINYQDTPGLYIQSLGTGKSSGTGQPDLYLITAYGYGGNPDTVAVVQSTYQITSSVLNGGK